MPFGHYKNPSIYDPVQLHTIAALIERVDFAVSPFTDALSTVTAGDFVYLDPPYAPETPTSFVGYTADGFTTTDHTTLFSLCHTIHTRGARFLLSNANVPLVTSAFPSPPYTTKIVVCRRAIHSKKPDATTNEVLITN